MTPSFADPAAPSRPLHLVRPEDLPAFLDAQPPALRDWLTATGFEAGAGELRLLPGADGVAAAVAGLGTAKARARGRFLLARAAAGLPPGDWHLDGALSASERDEAALAFLLHAYRFDRYRPGKAAPGPVRLKAPEGVDAARLLAMAEGEFLTRDLINTPAQDMGPEEMEAALRGLAHRFGAGVTVTKGDDLLTHNFPMIHAVGRASPRAPRLLEMRWGNAGPHLTLVGKGVCFDTGGLNIKTGSYMQLMKKDMGGAATVLGLALMIMQLGLPLRLRVLIPAVENVIAGNALKPKDILTSRKGLTVEVNNTDAEGRLVLADALALADEEAPDLLISMATLTGAARVALGPDLPPFFCDDDRVAAALQAAGRNHADPIWRMPFWEPYESLIEPGIADLDNAPGGGFAGAITAALFLRRFTGRARHYAHFDIYGWQPSAAPGRPKGGAGQGMRAILHALPEILS